MVDGDELSCLAKVVEMIGGEEEISPFARLKCAARITLAEDLGSMLCGARDGLGGKSSLQEELELAMLGPTRNPCGRGAGIRTEADEGTGVVEGYGAGGLVLRRERNFPDVMLGEGWSGTNLVRGESEGSFETDVKGIDG